MGKDCTAIYRPWKIIFTKEFTEKSKALQLEKCLKTRVGRDFIKTL
ncbi:MAG: GIY-YIG nuclease family protein, partial [Niabella sp.]